MRIFFFIVLQNLVLELRKLDPFSLIYTFWGINMENTRFAKNRGNKIIRLSGFLLSEVHSFLFRVHVELMKLGMIIIMDKNTFCFKK